MCTGARAPGRGWGCSTAAGPPLWLDRAQFARRYPAVEVVPDAIFVRHGRVTTSAGVTAGIDLSLALVADYHGQDLARQIARWLVGFLQRPGGQSQFSVRSSVPAVRSDGLRVLLDSIAADPAASWTVAEMAHRATTSTRHLARRFRARSACHPRSMSNGPASSSPPHCSTPATRRSTSSPAGAVSALPKRSGGLSSA